MSITEIKVKEDAAGKPVIVDEFETGKYIQGNFPMIWKKLGEAVDTNMDPGVFPFEFLNVDVQSVPAIAIILRNDIGDAWKKQVMIEFFDDAGNRIGKIVDNTKEECIYQDPQIDGGKSGYSVWGERYKLHHYAPVKTADIRVRVEITSSGTDIKIGVYAFYGGMLDITAYNLPFADCPCEADCFCELDCSADCGCDCGEDCPCEADCGCAEDCGCDCGEDCPD